MAILRDKHYKALHEKRSMQNSQTKPSFYLMPISLTAFCLLCVLFITTFSSTGYAQTNNHNDSSQNTSSISSELPLKDLRLFTLIFDHIRRSYVEPISDQQLLENAIKGMLGEIDPHSVYLDASSFQHLQESTHGEFTGVGIEMSSDKGRIYVITPIDDSPAKKAGILAGDTIIKINQKTIQGLSLNDVSQTIRDSIGTSIEFTIVRENVAQPLDIIVEKGTIKSVSVRHKMLDDHIAYIRIAQFQSETGKDFSKAIKTLLAQPPEQQTLNGLIIDLRNNPGGILQESVKVVDSLLNEGIIVSTKGRLKSSNTEFIATTGDETNGLPIIVLVNSGSASASEIVAGALQDHKRALIMGTQTFGKGSVQTILPVGDNKGIKLTTARYITPSGRSIQAKGITPDIIVEPATITAINTKNTLRESNLGGHLKNNSLQGTDKDITNNSPDSSSKDSQTIKDNQLFEAINVLKGVSILGR